MIVELFGRVMHARRIAGAFLRVAVRLALSYPLSFFTSQARMIVPVFTYFFIARLLNRSGPSVGGDYFTFVVIGLAAMGTMQAALQALSKELDRAINQGRFEALLCEPVPWRALPLGLVQWSIVSGFSATVLLMLASLPLGAHYQATGFPLALVILALGTTASVGIGMLSAGGKILTKRSDPLLMVYGMVAGLLSGALFPLSLLPDWLRVFSWLIPHTYVIGAARGVLMPGAGTLSGPSGAEAMVGLLIFNIVVFPIALWTFGRALNIGRRLGLLGGY